MKGRYRVVWKQYIPLFNGEYTVEEISKKCKINLNTVNSFYFRFKDELGLKVKGKNKRGYKREIIIDLFEKGKTINEVLVETGFDISYIREVSLKNGYTNRKNFLYSDEEIAKIIKLYNAGKNISQIALELKRTYVATKTMIWKLRKGGDIN